MAGHPCAPFFPRADAYHERACGGESGTFPLCGARFHPEMYAGGPEPSGRQRTAPLSAVLLGLALFRGQSGTETPADGQRLDVVCGVVPLRMESQQKS